VVVLAGQMAKSSSVAMLCPREGSTVARQTDPVRCHRRIEHAVSLTKKLQPGSCFISSESEKNDDLHPRMEASISGVTSAHLGTLFVDLSEASRHESNPGGLEFRTRSSHTRQGPSSRRDDNVNLGRAEIGKSRSVVLGEPEFELAPGNLWTQLVGSLMWFGAVEICSLDCLRDMVGFNKHRTAKLHSMADL